MAGSVATSSPPIDTAPTPDFRPGPDGRDSHDTVLLEWTARNPRAATYDGGPPRELMRLEQPYPNHNAGQLAFGSDGYLYFGLGDGGSGGDPLRNGQNPNTLLGSMLRIDVNTTSSSKPYGIPADNPFASGGGAPGAMSSGFWSFGCHCHAPAGLLTSS